jgi:hypothetical protein
VDDKKMTPLESLTKHPVAPAVGAVLLAASYLTDEPQPPPMPDGLPEATAQQWMMVYNQNQQRFARRMDMYKELGMALLGYSGVQTIMDALPKASAPLQLPAVDADAIRKQRGAM